LACARLVNAIKFIHKSRSPRFILNISMWKIIKYHQPGFTALSNQSGLLSLLFLAQSTPGPVVQRVRNQCVISAQWAVNGNGPGV
jgi:hypothetical protein